MGRIKMLLAFLVSIALLMSFSTAQDAIQQNKYFVKFKINGIQKSYSASVASFFDMQGKFGFQVASAKAASDTTAINLMVVASSPITANSNYTIQYAQGSYAPDVMVTVSYIISGLSFNSAVQTQDPGFKSAEITVSELTPSTIKGSFAGVLLRDPADASTVVFEITDGEFFAPRKQ